MTRVILAILALVLASLACATGPTTPRPSLYPSATPEITQTPFIVQVTTTPLDTPLPVVVEITTTPSTSRLCVNALVAVHLRPSPSNENYPVMVLPNGAEVTDLGGRSGKWMFVQYADKQGWIYGDYVGDCNG